jgi:hypothetical protein
MDIRLAKEYDSATNSCSKALITYIRLTAPDRDVLVADVFGTVIFH